MNYFYTTKVIGYSMLGNMILLKTVFYFVMVSLYLVSFMRQFYLSLFDKFYWVKEHLLQTWTVVPSLFVGQCLSTAKQQP